MLSDWIQSIFIIVLCSLFPMMDIFINGMKSVQNDWNLYRCNPVMMPFVSSFAPAGSKITTSDNFSYCVQSLMSSFAPTIMQPFSYLQSMSVNMMGDINDSLASSTSQSSWMSFSVAGLLGSVYGVFLNVIVEFNLIILKLLDVQGKLSAMITTILYVMTAVQYTFESMWNGVPGKMIKALGKK